MSLFSSNFGRGNIWEISYCYEWKFSHPIDGKLKNKQCSAVPDWIAKNRQMTNFNSHGDKWNAVYNELKKNILEHKGDPPQLHKLGKWMNNQ